MMETEVSYKFKRTSYAGKIHLVDTNSKQVVATGYGSFDTQKLEVLAQFNDSSVVSHDSVLTVLETADGYFAPLSLRDFHSMGWSQSFRQSMKQCMHWQISKGIGYIFDKFATMNITIEAQSEEETLTQQIKGDGEATLKKVARLTNLGSSSLSYYTVECSTGYSFTAKQINLRSDEHLNLNGTISFKVSDTRGSDFDFLSLKPTLFAFKAYWLMAHGNTDCTIKHLTLGGISFIFTHNRLLAPRSDVSEFRAIIAPSVELHLEIFLKCFYFMLNPDSKKGLAQSSKVGLALSSLVRYAYDNRPDLLDHEAVSLIAGFQSLLESIAQNKIKTMNKATKTATIAEIDRVLSAIKAIESDLSEAVKGFYLTSSSGIYEALSRPTFKQSVDVALEELGIDKAKYETTISVIDKARKQIVHHQDYNADFLMSLVTTGNTETKRDASGNVVQMVFGVKTGELDNLYDLTLDMARRYFDKLKV